MLSNLWNRNCDSNFNKDGNNINHTNHTSHHSDRKPDHPKVDGATFASRSNWNMPVVGFGVSRCNHESRNFSVIRTLTGSRFMAASSSPAWQGILGVVRDWLLTGLRIRGRGLGEIHSG